MKKISIVTGASSGMGVCFSLQLAKESANYKLLKETSKKEHIKQQDFSFDELWIIARRTQKLLEVKEKIQKESIGLEKQYPKIKIISLDISGKNGALELKKLFEEEEKINKETGGFIISTLVNNAGFGTYGEFCNTDVIKEMDMVELNCTALTGITGFALPYFAKNSRIINTASLASFLPLGNFAVYAASKAYVLSFSAALAAELKSKGIKVTALCPGPVSTEFANVASNGARKKVKHGLSPEKTVEHCLKLSSKGKLYALWAFKWKFKALASRFIGRYVGAWFTYKFCKRPSQ